MTDIILLPTYNEKENVEIIIPEIFVSHPDIKVLVIDDNSPDGTAAAAEFLMEKYPNLSILKRREKQGLGRAYADAMQRVSQDKEIRAVITMDADGSHGAGYLKNLLREIENYDVVIGSRYVKNGGVENWEFWRRLLSRFGNFYAKILTGLPINDFTAGFICSRREFLEKIDFSEIGSSGYSFLIELKFNLIKKLGARVKESPIIFRSRRGGESKISSHIIKEGLKTPWRLFFKRIKIWQKK